MCELFCVSPGTVQTCVDTLKKGHILAISPGKIITKTCSCIIHIFLSCKIENFHQKKKKIFS